MGDYSARNRHVSAERMAKSAAYHAKQLEKLEALRRDDQAAIAFWKEQASVDLLFGGEVPSIEDKPYLSATAKAALIKEIAQHKASFAHPPSSVSAVPSSIPSSSPIPSVQPFPLCPEQTDLPVDLPISPVPLGLEHIFPPLP